LIAVTHPGKMGDTLYALPLARLLYGINGEKIDFYTSEYCRPLKELIEYQQYINQCIIPANYTIERMDMGCQPWLMPVQEGYSQVYHAGFKSVPDRAIHQFIASEHGYYGPLGISYEYPVQTRYKGDYICIAPRGETTYKELFNSLAQDTQAIIIGGKGDYTGYGIDATGISMLDTLSLLAYAKGFVGLMSSQLVLANGFPYPKISPHDGKSWDMRHVVYTASNHYPINPTLADLKALLDIA
jgi:hypothetical protein